LNALRNGTPIADKKLQSLHEFTRKVVESRGFVSDADVDMFINAGYTKANILDVVAGVALKVMSNYTNHITKTPVDDFAKKNVWIHPINRTNVA
jgi:alkylhydroperoxidase family enzyme